MYYEVKFVRVAASALPDCGSVASVVVDVAGAKEAIVIRVLVSTILDT